MRVEVEYKPLGPDECSRLKEKGLKFARENKWGTYGSPSGELKYIYIIDLSTEHIENILITQPQVTPEYRAAMIAVLNSRKN